MKKIIYKCIWVRYKRGFYLGLRVQGWLNSSHTQKGWLMMIMWEIFFLSYCIVQRTFLPFVQFFIPHQIFCFVHDHEKTLREFRCKGSKKEKLSHHLYRLQRVKFTLTHLDTTTPIHPTRCLFLMARKNFFLYLKFKKGNPSWNWKFSSWLRVKLLNY